MDGDDPASDAYNRPVRFAGAQQKMWREDGLYDLVVVLITMTVPASGMDGAISALRGRAKPTEGCVASAPDRGIRAV